MFTPTYSYATSGLDQRWASNTKGRDAYAQPAVHSAAENALIFHGHVLIVAEVLGIAILPSIALQKFAARLEEDSWRVEIVPAIRDLYFYDNVKSLKEQLLHRARDGRGELKTTNGFWDLIFDVPEFGADLLHIV